jgi:pyruvate formate lyase activating enzyme
MDKAVTIAGVEKLSTIDYPGKTCSIAFLPGCNFRCPFCQNPDLIENPDGLEKISEDEFLRFVKSRKKWLDGVCVSGGEPCLHEGLPGFIRKIKGAGFLVKLDTNGTNPGMLEVLIRERLLDYIAMDIKAPLERYGEVAGADVDLEAIQRSVDLIRESGVDHEFRTTVVPGMHDREDIEAIGKWLKGADSYFVQGFRPENCLDRSLRKRGKFSQEELGVMAGAVKGLIKRVEVRE